MNNGIAVLILLFLTLFNLALGFEYRFNMWASGFCASSMVIVLGRWLVYEV